jgi:steroid delta-isomerase-like uncharacterized protein
MSNLEAIAREYMESFNRRDWVKIRSLLGDQYSYTGGDGQRMDGPEAGIAVAQMFAGAMSDAKITIKTIHVSGDIAITEFIGSGTHDGDFMGIPASGRKVTMPVCDVIEVKDGKIVAEREYMDMAHMFQQMGATSIPQPATA